MSLPMTAGENADTILDSNSYLGSQSCVPQDRLEDIDFFPCFDDDFIRLTDDLLPDVDFDFVNSFDGIHSNGVEEYNCFDDNRRDSAEVSTIESLDSFHDEDVSQDNSSRLDNTFVSSNNVNVTVRSHVKKPRTKRLRNRNRKLDCSWLGSALKRKCFHCQAERSPLWRIGPMGLNTLCNACGLKYKMGRLVPQYRPAASPSFDRTKHSNFYKRIMPSKLCEERNSEEQTSGEVVNG